MEKPNILLKAFGWTLLVVVAILFLVNLYKVATFLF